MLRSNGVRTILIGGIATEGGVEGTRAAAGNVCYDVLKDCVGSRHRELHELALKLMEQTHFDIATSSDIASIWRRT
jgi:nicotinamidase-related amidase